MPPPDQPWRAAAAQVFVADLADPRPDVDSTHHLARVLRLRPGETVCAADGSGRWRPCVWTEAGGLEPTGDAAGPVPAAGPPVTIAFAPPKGDRPELVVQKLTELGVDRVVLVAAERSVVRWAGDRAARHVDRLGRIAREAALQCRRLTVPAVELGDLRDVLAAGAGLADLDGRPPEPGDTALAVGPEGGWTDAERHLARELGAPQVRLATHVLRSETAAIAAGVVCTLSRLG